jgi:uncharacterized protein (TIGR02118 family)
MTILHPRKDDSLFDLAYYTSRHMPMVAAAFGAACRGWGVIDVASPDHHAMGWVLVESMEAFDAGAAEHGQAMAADLPNYTNVLSTVVLGSEVAGEGFELSKPRSVASVRRRRRGRGSPISPASTALGAVDVWAGRSEWRGE